MKSKLIPMVLAIGLASISNGATTITAFNAVAGTTGYATQVITGVDGSPFVNGTVLIGTFSSPTGLSTTVGNISLATFGWTQFATAPFSTNAVAPGVFGAFAGAGQTLGATGTLPTTSTGPFIGNNIYAVVANAAGTDFVIWNSGLNFVAEVPDVGGAAVSFGTRESTLVRGIVDPNGTSGLGGPLAARNGGPAVTFGAIPEPSAALLGVFGALGLLRRRRN